MRRPRQPLSVFLAALLVAATLAGGSMSASAASLPSRPPTVPGQPRNGDPDLPEWGSKTSTHGSDAASKVMTLWGLIRAMLARDGA